MPERLSTKKSDEARSAKPAGQLIRPAPLATVARAADPAEMSAASPAQLRQLQRQVGNRALNRLLAAKTIQAKLTVGPANDRYEQEADQSASAVMRMAPATTAGSPGEGDEPLQRQSLEEDEPIQRQALDEDEPIQRLAAPAPQVGLEGGEAGSAIEAKLTANRGAGAPLPDATRAKMETGLGADFSGVRIHTGAEAAGLNQQLGAQAFTHGADVYMGAGKYAPGSSDGQHLLAHELTHVVQQGGAVQRTSLANATSKIQRYTTIAPQASTTLSTAFQPTLSGDAQAGYRVTYEPVNVAARPLNLSETGSMAIFDGAEAQVRSFFISPAVLQESNADLERTKSKVRLVPTGGSVVVHNALTQSDAQLHEVEADVSAYRDSPWQTNSLFTQCKKFVQHVNPKVGGYEEAFKNETPDALTVGERQALDERLRDLRLAAGDAFQIASAGKETKKGWNEHYAGIVAVDGDDHVTLENFNRDAEARGMMDADKAELARTVGAEIDELRKALAKSSFTNIKSNRTMRKQLAALNQRLKVYVSVETKGTRDVSVATHYFKMFGPARSQQSFLDANMSDMDSPFSKLKVVRGGQPGERPTVNTEK